MSQPVQLFCWHFMAYPYLADNFDETEPTGWVTVPNRLWDRDKARGLYQEYIDQLSYGDQLGFDGMVLNEHHQNIYGLMPSPNMIAAALTQTTTRGKIVVLGNLLPLHMNPLRVAEEYAMLDNMSNGRIIAGLAPGSGPETFNYDVPSAPTREQFWEAVDLVTSAWSKDGPFRHEGRWYPLRYVNTWPRPVQVPHPPVWVPGSRSKSTMVEVAKRGFAFFLSSRSHGEETARSQREFAQAIESTGDRYQPFRMGILLSVYVGETDEQAKRESREGIWYFLKNCLKGHLRRTGRQLTFGPGIPYVPPKDFRALLQHSKPDSKLLGDADSWEELEKSNSIIVGSAETVYRRLSQLIEESQVGNLLIQFHLGNMKQDLVRKSMKRFIEEVAPRLREESKAMFAERYGRELEHPRALVGVGAGK
ncbi:MAG TPA: LLM class flavin-dependent oxidoreductase [Alphaproteobacteria bacterium]|jgi:alkanesulfonate monooxygenase SsuD/methylene tetrahydromethanopterin reductase-like flavin-dependent oxidoreductase (luciferase family)|nr:LLM class flavin-dependent oxidoreductase [Alphaproteobacteria bacterium]